MTDALWRDLQQVMSTQDVQSLVSGWLRAKLDADADVRLSSSPEAIAAHTDALVQEFGGALLNKVQNDSTLAKRHVAELLNARQLTLDLSDLEAATRLMMQAHLDLFRAVVARREKRWRPWLDDDPAREVVARVTVATPVMMDVAADRKGEGQYGRLSDVARDAIADIARQDHFPPKRVADYWKAVETFTSAFADLDLGEVTPDMAGAYVRNLTRYPNNATKREPYRDLTTFKERIDAANAANEPNVLSPTTINTKYVTPLRRIFEWRRLERRDLTNPFNGVAAPKSRRGNPKGQRRSFSDKEVARLLALPVFTGAAGDEGSALHRHGTVKVDDWRCWVPLICLFTGMRLNEACGLAVADVRTEDDICFFHVRDDAPGQRLKSDAARRKVPVHDALVQVGFLQFVDRQRASGRTRLFEELKGDASGYFSSRASKFFHHLIARVADDQPDDPGKLVFHSTRHTVITKLRAAGVRSDVSKALVGHEQNDTHGDYGDTDLSTLASAVDKISYRGLDLRSLQRT